MPRMLLPCLLVWITAQAQLRFVPGTEGKADFPYVVRAVGVGDRPQARFVDAEGQLVYGFRTTGLTRLELSLRLANNFRVWTSTDLKQWREVLNAATIHGRDRHDGEITPYRVDLTDLLPTDAIYVRFGDASPMDGWGAYVAEVELVADAPAGHDWVVPPPPPPPGTITEWLVLGAFPVTRDNLLAIPADVGGPAHLGPPTGGEWRLAKTKEGRLDFRSRSLHLSPNEDALAFAHVFAYVPEDTDAWLFAGSDDALAVWVNGALLWRHQVLRGCHPDEDRLPLCLGKGWNRLLLAVGNGAGGWECTARFLAPNGLVVPGLRVQAQPPAELHGELPTPVLPPRLTVLAAGLQPSSATLDGGRLQIPCRIETTNRGGPSATALPVVLHHGAEVLEQWSLPGAERGIQSHEFLPSPATWRVLAAAQAPLQVEAAGYPLSFDCPFLPRLLAEAGDALIEDHPEQARILQRLGLARRHWRKAGTPAPEWRVQAAQWLALALDGKWDELAAVANTFQEADGSPWATSVQCAAPAGDDYDVSPDAVMVYGGRDPAPRLQQWRRRGARVQIMTGIAWGDYQDYQDGRYDGTRHDDEIQTQKNGDLMCHGGDVYYWVPTEAYGNYLCQRLAPALDLPADGVCLEEPEFWMRAGWSSAFRREWASYFGEPWQAPDSSPEARYRAWQLRRFLYTRCLRQVADFLKQRRPDWECIVATHSLINYTSWGIASPESALGGIDSCDTVIAQVWNDTILTPCTYDGRPASRPFATAYLEFAQMAGMVGGTGRSLVFLADPVADNAQRSWEICRRLYETTVVAGLFQGAANRFELMPWPNRVFEGRRDDGSGEQTTMPASYRLPLLATCEALRTMPAGTAETSPLAVAVSDSMQAQAGFGEATGSADFFGQALPLVLRGWQPRIVHLEQLGKPVALAGVRVLLLSYNGQTPPNAATHDALVHWVRDGGILLSLTTDDDPFQQVREWWNQPPATQRLPQQHLYAALGLEPNPAEGWHAVGQGQIFVQRLAPRELAATDRHQELAAWVADAAAKADIGLPERSHCLVRRGPYVAAAGLEESPASSLLALTGTYLDLFADDLALIRNPGLASDRCGLWVDLSQANAPCVPASASRIDGWQASGQTVDFVSSAPTGGEVITWVRLEHEPRTVLASQHNGVPVPVFSEWHAAEQALRLRYPASPDGIWLHIE